MSKEELQVNFRIPAELKRQIEGAAKTNNRSITAELVARLEKSFAQEQLYGNLGGQPLSITDVVYSAVANTIPSVISDIYKGLLDVGVSAETIHKAAMSQIQKKPQSESTETHKKNDK